MKKVAVFGNTGGGKSTLNKHLTPKYRDYIEQAQSTKSVYHIRSIEQISQFFTNTKF
jgi:ABC-type transport system involved in cytochrome bd biosynthesis fused ATPase/permease subunit